MLVHHFSTDPDIYCYVGKLPEHRLILWLFSNPGDKFIILVKSIVKPGSQSGTCVYIKKSYLDTSIQLTFFLVFLIKGGATLQLSWTSKTNPWALTSFFK